MEMGNSTQNKVVHLVGTEDKFLTWDTLQQKGWVGPSRCQLCKIDNESISHLFIHCIFSKTTWARINSILNYQSVWKGTTLT
jgi:hypothetical protein